MTTSAPTVLLVAPDVLERTSYREAFARTGCDIVEAGDGHDALVAALTRRPALIVTDVDLPRLDGAALCRVLRGDELTAHAHIVAVSTDQRGCERAHDAGADVALLKPVDAADVLARSACLLASSRALCDKSSSLADTLASQIDRADTLLQRSACLRTPARSTSGRGPRPRNGVLRRIPAAVFARLSPHLSTVEFQVRETVYKQCEPIDSVYFPSGGVYSVVSALASGELVEAATISDKGILGIEACLSDDRTALADVVMQVPGGTAERLDADVLRRAIADEPALRCVLGRYIQAVLAQTLQSAACLARHHVRHRTARWLLSTHDAMHGRQFMLSHDFLAMMLGVTRPTVSETAAAFQRAGLIRYTRGLIRVVDRAGLEAESCECYAVVRGHFSRLLQSHD